MENREFILNPDRISTLMTLLDYKIHEQSYFNRLNPEKGTPYVEDLQQMCHDLMKIILPEDRHYFVHLNPHLASHFCIEGDTIYSVPERIKLANDFVASLSEEGSDEPASIPLDV
jgi:hypothetical protein